MAAGPAPVWRFGPAFSTSPWMSSAFEYVRIPLRQGPQPDAFSPVMFHQPRPRWPLSCSRSLAVPRPDGTPALLRLGDGRGAPLNHGGVLSLRSEWAVSALLYTSESGPPPSDPSVEMAASDKPPAAGPNSQPLNCDQQAEGEQKPKKKKKKKAKLSPEEAAAGAGDAALQTSTDQPSSEEKKKKKKPKEKKEPKEPKAPKTPKTPKAPKEPKEKKAKSTTPKAKSTKKPRYACFTAWSCIFRK
ncbi:hypothetical protein COCON_G00068340 [Conger conger]|uniref:Uncharacterized protein n=1 Tax=Conger conger TaxID=82655 RepID=A0A9Q1I497_CONCO|nr:hypothetical protein COCON_G00068340 [Conger conger]